MLKMELVPMSEDGSRTQVLEPIFLRTLNGLVLYGCKFFSALGGSRSGGYKA